MICGFFMDNTDEPLLLILVGPMGAGKTTIGKLLAHHYNFEFFDSDQMIVQRTGASISWIFEKEGESGFRKRESCILEQLTTKSQVVLATGGGAVVLPQNHEYLKRGIVIYLRASVDVQYERTCRDRNRPLLQTDNPKQRLTELFAIRDPIYQGLADITVTTGYLSPKKMVHEIIHQLQSHGFLIQKDE